MSAREAILLVLALGIGWCVWFIWKLVRQAMKP